MQVLRADLTLNLEPVDRAVGLDVRADRRLLVDVEERRLIVAYALDRYSKCSNETQDPRWCFWR